MIKTKKELVEVFKKNVGNVIEVKPSQYFLCNFYYDNRVARVYYTGSELTIKRRIKSASSNLVNFINLEYELKDKEKFLQSWIDNFINSIKFNEGVSEKMQEEIISNLRSSFKKQTADHKLNLQGGDTSRLDFPKAGDIKFADEGVYMYNNFYKIKQ